MGEPSEGEVREWLDRLAIADLIYRYSDAVTRADWGQAEELFVPEATWESPLFGLHHQGRAAFIAFLRDTDRADLLIQTAHPPVVRLVPPDRATATTTVHELVRGAATADSALGPAGSEINFEQLGIYSDEIVRADGAWRFMRRVFTPLYVHPDRVTGQVIAERRSLTESPASSS